MSFRKLTLLSFCLIFAAIGAVGLYKKFGSSSKPSAPVAQKPKEISPPKREKPRVALAPTTPKKEPVVTKTDLADDLPAIDRTFELFTTGPLKLPIVETITYSTKVPWLKGRLAWIADYASHFSTSRHFIARSLNGKPDYFTQTIKEGSRFNVLKKDKNIQFHLLVDLTRAKMGFYYVDLDSNERVLLKTYRVGLGKKEAETPAGKFVLGDKIAVYQPQVYGYHLDQKVEMIQVFGTRWLPMGEMKDGKPVFKGYGIQGAPWMADPQTSELAENRSVIGAFESDGCIRMAKEDIEELFAIVVSRPTFVEVVRDFHEAHLPGVEVAAPKRL